MKSTMMHTPMTVQMIMHHGARVFPDSQVGVFDGKEMQHTAYAEIAANASRLASGLASLGQSEPQRRGWFAQLFFQR